MKFMPDVDGPMYVVLFLFAVACGILIYFHPGCEVVEPGRVDPLTACQQENARLQKDHWMAESCGTLLEKCYGELQKVRSMGNKGYQSPEKKGDPGADL